MQQFTTLIRVCPTEIDALGHVNNVVYQQYLERAAVEHSAHLGFDLARYREFGGVFVMRRIGIEYLRPAIEGDALAVTTWLADMRGTRAVRRYEIRKDGSPDLLVTAEALWVWVDLAAMRPRPLPAALLDAFTAIETPARSRR